MGVVDCPEETKVQLLRQVLELDLGFPEAQLRSAINYLVKEIGSSEEALAWIPQDNFTILVNYILDNDTDLECQQLRSPACCKETREMGNQLMLSAQGGNTGTEERRKGGNLPTKGAVKKEFLNGYLSDGNVPLKVDQSGDKIKQRNNTSPPQRGLVDRNELRKHYKKKLCIDFVKVSDHSTDFQVNEARALTTQTEHTNSGNLSGQFISNKKSRSSVAPLQRTNSIANSEGRVLTTQTEHTNSGNLSGQFISNKKSRSSVAPLQRTNSIANSEDRVLTTQTEHTNSGNLSGQFFSNKKSGSSVAPLQRTNSIANSVDQKTRKIRESEMHSLKKKPYSPQKKGKIPEPEATKKLVWEARTSIPSGCLDLATGLGSPQDKIADCSDWSFSQNQSSVAAHDDRSQVETVAQQSGGKKAAIDGYFAAKEKPCIFVDVDGEEEIRSTSSRLKSLNTGYKTETCRAEILSSNNDRQNASCSVLDGCLVKEEQDHVSYEAWLVQLEAFLKEGNCERALEALEAWKQKGQQVETWHIEGNCLEGRGHEMVADIPGKKRGFVVSCDISRGLEKLPISCVNEYNTSILPENFLYVSRSVIRQAAHVDISFGRIGDLHCCCSDDCLRSSEACKCTDSTRGEYAYDKNGLLIERLAISFQSGCTTRNGDFIMECCEKCRCSMNCGNRIVQRGITRKLQVFMTPTNKGWGVRALEKIPARSFVFEYLGEIATNSEQYDRNLEYEQNGVYTYTMNLDADIDMENNHFKEGLNDNEALVLDATIFGNVSRFVNHRCNDANLFMRPVQIETRDTHYYHAAFFTARDIEEMEELTWDYGIDFEDNTHLVKAFQCHCKSSFCRDKESPFNKEKPKKGKNVKSSHSKHKDGQHERR